MAAPRVIAKDYRDAVRFARDVLGVSPTRVRVVNSVASLAGFGYTLHLAPGWERNPAVHAIRNKIKYKRGIEIIDHAAEIKKESTRPVETIQITEVVYDDAVADAFEPNVAAVLIPDGAFDTPAPSKPRKYRKRCKQCGEMVEPAEVDAHAAAHEE